MKRIVIFYVATFQQINFSSLLLVKIIVLVCIIPLTIPDNNILNLIRKLIANLSPSLAMQNMHTIVSPYKMVHFLLSTKIVL